MDPDTRRRASAHVERGFDNSGFGFSGGGSGDVGGGAGGSNIAERRRSTSFLASAPDMSAEDNELFMSDEFRMYCYKVRGERVRGILDFFPLLSSSTYAARFSSFFSSLFFVSSCLAQDEPELRPTHQG